MSRFLIVVRAICKESTNVKEIRDELEKEVADRFNILDRKVYVGNVIKYKRYTSENYELMTTLYVRSTDADVAARVLFNVIDLFAEKDFIILDFNITKIT